MTVGVGVGQVRECDNDYVERAGAVGIQRLIYGD